MASTHAIQVFKPLALLTILFVLFQVAASARNLTNQAASKHASVKLAKNPDYKPSNITRTQNLVHVFEKLKRPLPASVKAAWDKEKKGHKTAHTPKKEHAPRAVGRVIGTQPPLSFGYYLFSFSIGTPQKAFSLVFDTGSSDLWTWGVETWLYEDWAFVSQPSMTGRNYYDPAASSTATDLVGQTFLACYRAGTCYGGDVGLDTVYVGDLRITENPVPRIWWQNSGTVFDGFFDGYPAVDGVFGLGLAPMDGEIPNPISTLSTYLFPQLWPLGGFTTSFIDGVGATVDFHWVDEDKYWNDLVYTPALTGTPYWTFNWNGYQNWDTVTTSSPQVIIQSSDDGMLFPPSIKAAYEYHIFDGHYTAEGYFYFPCEISLPSFDFFVGPNNTRFSIPGHYFKQGSAGWIGQTEYCWSGFDSSHDEGIAMLGMPFYHTFFVVHDMTNMRIGIAELNTEWVEGE